jgi:dTDP-4-dehydrorhamnose reductase
MMRLYVTGGTGLVGSNVIKIARERYHAEVIASQYGPSPEWNVDYELDWLDMSDSVAVRASILKYKPDAVIHCAALIDQTFIHTQRKRAWSLMVGGTRTFARACREVGARLVFISSDWVFNGRENLVDEDSPPLPVNFYGIMKVVSESEIGVLDGLNYAVARLAGVYGLNYAMPSMTRWEQGIGFGDIPNYYVRQFEKGDIVRVWSGSNLNESAHPTLASDGADMVLRLVQHDATGIFHAFGTESISRLELARRVADVFDGDHALIEEVPTDAQVVEEFKDIPVPHRLNASTEKTAKLLGRKAYNVVQGLQAFKAELQAYRNSAV